MLSASPYRIAGERRLWVEPVAPRADVAPRAPGSEANIEGIAHACAYDAPDEADVAPAPYVILGLAIGGLLMLVFAGLLALLHASITS